MENIIVELSQRMYRENYVIISSIPETEQENIFHKVSLIFNKIVENINLLGSKLYILGIKNLTNTRHRLTKIRFVNRKSALNVLC